jgi:3-hydroxyisobutyrate dehydrogenase-like beta-hydroxyacid dehydrogenase
MTVETIGALGLGDMGGAVATALKKSGFNVITTLAGRSAATVDSASDRGIKDVGGIADLVRESDLIISVLVPANAPEVAASIAAAAGASDTPITFADCNAIAPASAIAMGKVVTDSGTHFVDGGVIGGPPRDDYAPRFYVSGPDLDAMMELDGRGIQVVPVGPEIGRASAVKMVYASQTKGIAALQAAMLVSARRLGVYDELISELESSQAANLERASSAVTRLPSVAGRWIGEMEEIASTFESVGISGGFHQGAAEIFRLVDASDTESAKSLDDLVKAFAAAAT